MADTLATFNAYNYRTYTARASTVKSAVFTPDSDKVYLVKVMHAANYTGSQASIDVLFYDGEQGEEFYLYVEKTLDANSSGTLLEGSGVIIRGDLGDELRIQADTDNAVDVAALVMIMGRDSGN